jgi:UDPglucose 6-dehydrogenase
MSLETLNNKKIAVLGLTYKTGTNTLRRSPSIMLINQLKSNDLTINVYDPLITSLPEHTPLFILSKSIVEAIQNADALVVMTDFPELKSITKDLVVTQMRTPLIIDQNGYLSQLDGHAGVRYLKIGKPI